MGTKGCDEGGWCDEGEVQLFTGIVVDLEREMRLLADWGTHHMTISYLTLKIKGSMKQPVYTQAHTHVPPGSHTHTQHASLHIREQSHMYPCHDRTYRSPGRESPGKWTKRLLADNGANGFDHI